MLRRSDGVLFKRLTGKSTRTGRGLGEQLAPPPLPSSVIGRWPAVFAPTRCIMGMFGGSGTVVGELVGVVSVRRRGVVCFGVRELALGGF